MIAGRTVIPEQARPRWTIPRGPLLIAAALLAAQVLEQALLFALMPPAAFGPQSGTEATDMLDVAAHPFPPRPPAIGAVLRYRRYLLPGIASFLPEPARPWYFWTAAIIGSAVAYLAMSIAFRRLVPERQAAAGALLLVALPSLWASARHGMPDETLLAFLALGWLAVQRDRFILGALLYGLACLTKETAALVVIGEAVVLVAGRRWRPALSLASGAAAFPIALWAALGARWQAPLWYLNVIPGVPADKFENLSVYGPFNLFDSAIVRGNSAVTAVNVLLIVIVLALAWRARMLPPPWSLGPVVALALLLWSDPVIYQGYLDREVFLVAWPLWVIVCRWCSTPRRLVIALGVELLLGFEQALEEARYFVDHKELRDVVYAQLAFAASHEVVVGMGAAFLAVGLIIILGPARAHLLSVRNPSSPGD